MSQTMPGVNISNEVVTLAAQQDASAVPVFIGYTQTGEPLQMVSVSSWEEFQSTFFPSANIAQRAEQESSALYQSLRLYFDNNGGECYVLPAAQITQLETDADSVAQQLIAALESSALADHEAPTLLCVPDIVELVGDIFPAGPWLQVWQAMLNICRARLGCFAILDLPDSSTKAALVLNSTELDNAAYGATYWPHLECTYLLSDQTRALVPPSGIIAAQIQHTDRTRGVWKAPANNALLQVVKPQSPPTLSSSMRNPAMPFNWIRSFPGRGVRVWGCQTLTTNPNSAFRYVQVRRLLGYVESRLYTMAHFCIFEPNNEITWLKIKSLFRSWLRSLWLKGALFGTSEDEAFRLYVGLAESMTTDDLLAGQLIVRVELSALYPAEYINLSLRFMMMETQMSKELI